MRQQVRGSEHLWGALKKGIKDEKEGSDSEKNEIREEKIPW